MKQQKWIYAVSAIAILAIFYFSAGQYKEQQKESLSFLAKENSEYFIRNHAPRKGAKDAKVYLVEFLDPECESCRRFHPEVKNILKKFEGKVQLVIRYAPFHRNSEIAVKALEASRMQGKYWEALDLLFETQPEWGNHHNPQPEKIFEYLPKIGLDMERLRLDMELESINQIIKQDTEDLQILGVRGTPTFFVNGKPLERFGMGPLEQLLSEEVSKAYK